MIQQGQSWTGFPWSDPECPLERHVSDAQRVTMSATNHLSHPKYRPDIDGLRAIAVLSVVIFHAFPKVLRGGFVGVDIFFVISGFLISTIVFENLERGTFSFTEFYSRRIRRIFPALLLVLAACTVFGWFALLADEYKQFGKHVAAGAAFIANFALWGEAGYFDNSAETKPLLHLWSLGVEEQFYVVWPVLLWCTWRLRQNVLAVLLLFFALSFAFNIYGIRQDAVATFYLPHTRFWELLSGGLLAWFSIRKPLHLRMWFSGTERHRSLPVVGNWNLALSNWLSMLGALLLIYGFAKIGKRSDFPGWWALVPVCGTLFVIMAGPSAFFNRIVLSNRLAVWLGLISFPLYLWHWPLLSFARIVESDQPAVAIRTAAVALAVLLAWVTYRFVERPVRNGGLNTLKVLVLAGLMVVVCVLGMIIFNFDGLEKRQSIAAYPNNKNELLRTVALDQPCLDYVGIQKPLFPYCRYHDAGAKETIAVIGDSHAHVAYPGIQDLATQAGKNTVLLANRSCPPLPGLPIPGVPQDKVECADRVEQLLSVVASKKDIQTIIVFTRGVIYFTGTEPLTGQSGQLNGSEVSPEAFFSGTQKMIDFLVGAGKRVIYVTENPELRYLPQACMPRPLRIWMHDCSPAADDVYKRFAGYMAGVWQLNGATVVNSLDAFCSEDRCRVFDAHGSLLYADDDHLSVSGSRFQAQWLLRRFID